MRRASILAALALAACGKPDAPGVARLPDPRGLDTLPPAGAALTAVASPAFDAWVVKADTSPMDNSVSTRIATITDGRTPGADYAAMLFVQCTGPKLDIFIATDDVVDYHDDELAMRVRIDSAPPVAETWTRSSDDRGAFSQSPRALFAKLRSAHRLLIEMPIYNKGRQVASWSLDGLANHIAALPCVKP